MSNVSSASQTATVNLEEEAIRINALGRESLVAELLNFDGRFTMDLTEDFIRSQSNDRLRHILLAAVAVRIAKTSDAYTQTRAG